MTPADIAQMLEDMTDDEIAGAIETARADMIEAAEQDPDSEWYQSCFAGFMIYAQEAQKRVIAPVSKSRLH